MNYFKNDGIFVAADIAPNSIEGSTKYFVEIDGKKSEISDEKRETAMNMGFNVSLEHEKETPWEKATKAEYDKYVKDQLNIK